MHTVLHSWSFRDCFKNDPNFDIFSLLEQTHELGFRALEVMTGKASCPPEHIGSEDPAHLEKVIKRAQELSIQIECWSTYNDFAFVKNETWRLANIAYIKQWIRQAAATGVPSIRLLTGYHNDLATPAHLEQLTYDAICECVAVAEETGVNLALENHSSVFMSADSILDLLKRVGSKRLTVCPDPTNWCNKFYDPGCPVTEKESMYRQLAQVAPHASHSHLKIRGISGNGELLGYDLSRIIGIYRAAGYDGAITFESIADGDLLAPLAEARRIVESALNNQP